jgi:hypothetical protein
MHGGAKIGHEPIEPITRAPIRRPDIPERIFIMFRTFAIALLAASVLTAPVLAQNATAPAPASADKSAPATPAAAKAVKTVKADRAVAKHVRHARHAHGTRMAKHVKHMKYAHHMKRHNVSTTTGAAAPAKQADTKPAAKSGAN